jgi:serine/threonine protein kinase
LRGLYFDKIKDKNDMWGFSLYHDSPNFRRRMLFHKDEEVIENWLKKLKHYCGYYSVGEMYTQTVRLGGGKFSEVFEASNKRTAVTYALKRIDKNKLN